jgi:hypothetical protein
MDDRRKNPRFPVETQLRLTGGGTSTSGRLRDICRDAALLETDAPQALGTFVTLALLLPGTGAGEIVVSGKVIRIAPGEGGSHASAVLFTEIPAAAAARIEVFLALQAGALG